MTVPAHLVLRSFYVVAGAALIVYSFAASSSRLVLYAPVIFGILLIIRGVSGA